MRPGAVAGAVRGGLGRRRRVQTVVIATVLLVSTASAVLGLALVVDSNAPFDRAFASQRGAHIVASIDPGRVTPSALAATRGLAPVTAAAGPFAVAEISGTDESNGYPAPVPVPPLSVAGRSSPGGPVDDVALQSGHWAQRPGQIVVDANGRGGFASLGDSITVTSAPGHPRLTVVGLATSASNSAGAWVAPAEIAALREPGEPARAQMLYRFRDAGDAAAIAADEAAVTRALPAGAVTGAQSYLGVKTQQTSKTAVYAPFVIAFAVIGLVMSVLIVASVVSGAVVTGYHRIGVLKSIGFTPAQVVAAYTGQIAVPAAVGCLGGLALGNLLAVPLLRRTATVYGVGSLGVPVWVDVVGRRGDGAAGRHRGRAAGAPGGAAECGGGARGRARPAHRPRLRRAPTAGEAAAPPPGDDRPRVAVRAAGADGRDARRGVARGHRGHVRGRADHVAAARLELPGARQHRAGPAQLRRRERSAARPRKRRRAGGCRDRGDPRASPAPSTTCSRTTTST